MTTTTGHHSLKPPVKVFENRRHHKQLTKFRRHLKLRRQYAINSYLTTPRQHASWKRHDYDHREAIKFVPVQNKINSLLHCLMQLNSR